MSEMADIGLDFIVWLDRSMNFSPIVQLPTARAAREIAANALKRGVVYGRITLWVWQAPNRVKIAVAMARINGDGGERPVRVIRAAPPFQDADKAELVLKGERA